jgi:hypothetical protein
MNRRNIGRFSISSIEDRLSEAQLILAGLVVVRAEMSFHNHRIEYTALGEVFAPVSDSEEIPIYDPLIIYDGMGGMKLKSWVRRR